MTLVTQNEPIRRGKYKAVPTVVDGIRFASKKEAKRYQELKLLVRANEIKDLLLQPRFSLTVDGIFICTYVGDFQYTEGNEVFVEDCKGFKTPAY
jgi:hypothetical protein